ncbi:MAG: glycosyltransferase family 4 protein [Ignavibacteriales bacterium]|nr:glycosyltransferase family 4 protein [Ignavibacteriales bacterium]
MNILLIHQYFLEKGDGGGSRFNEMTKIWESEGHSITVLAGMVHYASGKKSINYKGKFLVKESYSDNIIVYRCHVSEAYNVNFLGRLWAYFSFVLSSLYAGIFKAKSNYDIILVTSPPLFVGISGYLLSIIKRMPFVFEVRDLWPESAIDTGVLTNKYIIRLSYWFEKFIYKKAQKINVLTPAFKLILEEKKDVDSSKLLMIPNAADFSLSERISLEFNRERFRKDHGYNEKLVIIYVGAHGIANGLILLVEAAEILKDENIFIISIGSGMQKKDLIEEVKKRNLNNIKFQDPVSKEEVFKYILAADIGTSILLKNDTFKTIYSNKTFDYMSCEKPILLAIDGVSRELIEKAECGLFVEPENPIDYAEKVKVYLNDKKRISQDGYNGFKYAKENFDRNILAKQYLAELQKLSNV